MIKRNPFHRIWDREATARGKWMEYERRKALLRDLPPAEYEQAVRRIAEELGI